MQKDLLDNLGARERDRRALEAEGAGGDDSETDEARVVLASLLRPLSSDRADRILDRVAPRSNVRRWLPATALLASAAAVVLAIGLAIPRPAGGIDDATTQTDPPRPAPAGEFAYEILVLDALGSSRDAGAGRARFTAGDAIVLRLRPREATAAPTRVRVRAAHAGRTLTLAWPVRTHGSAGVLELVGSADELLREGEGDWTLELEVELPTGSIWRGQERVHVSSEGGP